MAEQEKLIELIKRKYTGDTYFNSEEIIIEKKVEKKEEEKKIIKNKVETKKVKKVSESEELRNAEEEYKSALAYIKDMISPAYMKIMPDKLQINNVFAKTFFVYGYPSYLESGWLSPIINWDVKFDMSFFIYPIESGFIQKYLKKRLTQLHSERSINAEKWLLNDPGLDAQIQDVEELRANLVRWDEKYFHFWLYITIFAENEEKLTRIWKDLEVMLGWRNVLEKPALLRAEQGFVATSPFAKDEIWVFRNISTGWLSTTFPFSSASLTHDDWILYWINTHNNSLIIYDRFNVENANMCVFAKSWGWKSFAVKLEILRSLMFWTDVIVIDPENEYEPLVWQVGGTYLDVSLNSDYRINPFDLPLPLKDKDTQSWDLLRSAVIELIWFMRIILWWLEAMDESYIEKALMITYSLKWITLEDDSIIWKEIPVMQDFYDVLETISWAEILVKKLEKYTTWIFSGLFSRETNIDLNEWLQVFSVRDLDEALRPWAMYVIMNYIWNKVRSKMKKRVLVIDEAWNIMQYEDTARFLFWLVKRARKYWLWVTTITQDVEDFMWSSYWKAIVTNSSTQLLLKQSTASIDVLQDIFKLTEQEKYILLNASVGQWLFFAWTEHVWIQILASFYEQQVIDNKL